MKSAMRLTGGLVVCLVVGIFVAGWRKGAAASPNSSDDVAAHSDKLETKTANSWDPNAAAAYLDRRQSWWMEWPRAQRDHETACVSCHTAVPYALSRSALRTALAEQAPSPTERRLLDRVTKRVRLWKEVEPFYKDADRGPYKSVESRGTESVLNALILSSRDAQNGQLSNDARKAFENMWAEQQIAANRKEHGSGYALRTSRKFRVGGLLRYGFRGLFSVHSRYGLRTRQVALCDPLHRRRRWICCLHRRSNCYRVERSSSRRELHPLKSSAFHGALFRQLRVRPIRVRPNAMDLRGSAGNRQSESQDRASEDFTLRTRRAADVNNAT